MSPGLLGAGPVVLVHDKGSSRELDDHHSEVTPATTSERPLVADCLTLAAASSNPKKSVGHVRRPVGEVPFTSVLWGHCYDDLRNSPRD